MSWTIAERNWISSRCKVKSVTGPPAETPWKDTDFGVYYKEPKTYLRAPLDESVFSEKSLKVFAFYCGMDTI